MGKDCEKTTIVYYWTALSSTVSLTSNMQKDKYFEKSMNHTLYKRCVI